MKWISRPMHFGSLARFYQQSKQLEKGLACLRQMLEHMTDVEEKANCVLAMGQMMEAGQDYESAVRYYKEAFALEPVQTDVWYFINNNLGFSLNTLGNFAEGEKYCRKAIPNPPTRIRTWVSLFPAKVITGVLLGAMLPPPRQTRLIHERLICCRN